MKGSHVASYQATSVSAIPEVSASGWRVLRLAFLPRFASGLQRVLEATCPRHICGRPIERHLPVDNQFLRGGQPVCHQPAAQRAARDADRFCCLFRRGDLQHGVTLAGCGNRVNSPDTFVANKVGKWRASRARVSWDALARTAPPSFAGRYLLERAQIVTERHLPRCPG